MMTLTTGNMEVYNGSHDKAYAATMVISAREGHRARRTVHPCVSSCYYYLLMLLVI